MRFGILGNTTKYHIIESVRTVLQYGRNHGLPIQVEEEVATLLHDRAEETLAAEQIGSREHVARESDIVITFGGDGTMLQAAQTTIRTGTPILGINQGKLGFLAAVNAHEITAALDTILAGGHTIDRRLTIAGEVEGIPSFTGINDIVVHRSGTARVIKIDAFVNREYVATFHADGIIVATPTGSTAYSLAVGGPIVAPTSPALLLCPISPHTLTARPIVLPQDSVIDIQATSEDGDIMVVADGRAITVRSQTCATSVRRGDHDVTFVNCGGSPYFETLRGKLSWAYDARLATRTTS